MTLADRIADHLLAERAGRRRGREIVFPCPYPERHRRGDRRPSAAFNIDKRVWCCRSCEASGGERSLAAALGIIIAPSWETPPPRRRAPTEPRYPPVAEVDRLWSRAVPVDADPEAAAWLRSRRLRPEKIADVDFARVLPADHPCPPWARYWGRSWPRAGYQLVLPVHDGTGRMRSLRARRIDGGEPKEIAPRGYSVKGLVLADPLARLLLAGDPLGNGTPSTEAVREVGIVVVEGVPDFLVWVTRYGDAAEDAPAVIGIVSGSWTAEIAAHIPEGTRVAIRTHNDPAGRRYAERIAFSLRDRGRLFCMQE